MKVSLNWLNSYIPIDMDAADLAEALTMTGLEVEAAFDRFAYLADIVAGRIKEVEPHPEAQNLALCRVDIGEREVTVVCGAPNAEAGGIYPYALPGARLPGGLTVEKAKIRSVLSEGMLCSEAELGLGRAASGLMQLDQGTAEGTPLARALGASDIVLELGLTPNRPDCLSLIGVGREVAAITGRALQVPNVEPPHNSGAIDELTSVTIKAPELCPRYAARLVEGITVAPSPFWLQDRLTAVDIKPINNIVDITNFVMMETGQPLHAFDFERLSGHRIVVRTAEEAEPFTTLDGRSHRLSAETLVICDARKPVAIAGVMGGENSEISENTTRVLIESACFDPASIRRTAKRLGISTDASHRFERGVDPEGTLYALERTARLMAEIAGGTPVEGLIDKNPLPHKPRTISLSVAKTNRHLGTALSSSEMQQLLESVEFHVARESSDSLAVRAPSFRVDVSRPEDLMEEVARLWGYNRIATTFPKTSGQTRLPERGLTLRETVRDLMCGFGFTEAINYSFTARDSCDRLRLPDSDQRRRLLDIVNPLSEEQAVMRTSLVPAMLEAMRRNLSHQVKDLMLFEMGKVFFSNGPDRLPDETEMLCALWTGLRIPASWQTKPEPCDFYDLKGIVEALLSALKTPAPEFTAENTDAFAYLRPGSRARIRISGRDVGCMGEVHPGVLESFDLRQTAFLAELNCEQLMPLVPDSPKFSPIPRFPAVSRDITLIVDTEVPAGAILSAIYEVREPLLETARIFDLYSGDPIPHGKKSISMRLIYRSSDATLDDASVNRIHEGLTQHLIRTFNASLPA
jgi:phenylalanyl-tRNA synthetase beta chain